MERTEVIAYNFVDLLFAIEAQVKQGYTFDLDDVKNYPQTFGHYYVVPMVKSESKEVKQEVAPAQQDVVQSQQAPDEDKTSGRGRKAKQA